MAINVFGAVIESIKKQGFSATLITIKRGLLLFCSEIFLYLAVYSNSNWPKWLCFQWPLNETAENTDYVFVFLGEFGYEIFNWQGVVRKFSRRLPGTGRILVAGRRGLEPFYETASQYIDISDFPPYMNSVAASYFALPPDMDRRHIPPTEREFTFDENLKKTLREHVLKRTKKRGENVRFVFSSELTPFPGCIFGVDHRYYDSRYHPGRIYDRFDILTKNNDYKKIEPDLNSLDKIEQGLGISLDEPYVLIQKRSRRIGPQGSLVDEAPLVAELSQRIKVVLLSFDSGRYLDSRSDLYFNVGNCYNYKVQTFNEQSCLIAKAKSCLFVTEGDLGSHTYLPPFMGKDVYVLASRNVFQKPSAPIAGWNKNVFRFGGQMIPLVAEEVMSSDEQIKKTVDKILS